MQLEEIYAGTTSEDVNMRLRGTFIGVRNPETGEITDVTVVERAGWQGGRIALVTPIGVMHSDMVALWPDAPLGFVNGQKTAYMMTRIPGRQNSAGLSHNTVRVVSTTGRHVDVTASVVRAAFLRRYPPGWQSFHKMEKDVTVEAQALSAQFAIVRTAEGLQLVYLGVPIAKMARNGKRIVLKSKHPDTIKSKWEELCALLKQPG